MIYWTDDMDAALIRLREAGETFREAAAQISARFGVRITRNAAIGRAARMCLSGSSQKARPRSIATIAKPRTQPAKPIPRWMRLFAAAPEPSPPATAPEGGVSFHDLNARIHCRFPLWGDEKPTLATMRYCGAKPQPGSSYCPACHPRVWRPLPKKQEAA